MAILTGWYGFISLAILALFSAFVASTSVSDTASINQHLHDIPSRLVPSFDAKCGCIKTVTCSPVVLTSLITSTNAPSYHTADPSQKPSPTTNSTETDADTLATYAAFDCGGTTTTFPDTISSVTALVPAPTTQTGVEQPGYSIPLDTSVSLISETSASSAQTLHGSSSPIVAPSPGTLQSPNNPGAPSTSSFSFASYAPITQSYNDSAVHSSTMSNMSGSQALSISAATSLSAYTTDVPRPAVPLIPNSNTQSYQLPSGSSSSTTPLAAVLSIPTDSTITVSSATVSSQGDSTFTFASPSSPHNSSTQTSGSTSPGRVPVPLSTTFSSNWANTTINSTSDPTSVPAYTSVAFTDYNTTLLWTRPGSVDTSSEASMIPSTETLTVTRSTLTTSSTSMAQYSAPSSPTQVSAPAKPACNSKPAHTNPDQPVLSDTVTRLAGELCNSKSYVAGSVFTRGSSPLVSACPEYGVEYRFNISWTPDTRDQCIRMPEGQLLPSIDDCQELLIRDYKECNNGGFGGSIEAGCLRFDFTPSLIFAAR